MTGWSTFEPAEVLSEFTEAEATTLKNIKGGTDTLGDICARVVAQIRLAYVNGSHEVDAENGATIPDGEKSKAIAIARWQLLISFPLLKSMQTAERKSAAEKADSYFAEIAKKEIQAAGSAEIACKPTRRATRSKTDGLL